MHAATGRESDFSRNDHVLPGSGTDGPEEGTGPFIEAVKVLHSSGIWSAGVSVSAFFVPFSTRNSTSTFQVDQRLQTYDKSTTDNYDVSAITPPSAPYEGTYEGPGPLIPNTPENRSVNRRMTSQHDVSHANTIDQELDIYHTSLSLGLRGDATFKRIALASSIGPTINWVRVNGKRTELLNETTDGITTTIDRRHDQISDDTLAIGAFIQAGAALRITERSQLALHGRYDLLDAIDGTIGPSNYAVDLDGYSLIATWLTTL